ncbi:MAG: GNAT family N-acetyltransferase [Erysipelotrichaceae bacterium]|nr:GNAT family N-acetyltransferase [Erysipelotrichaceae bacterium]
MIRKCAEVDRKTLLEYLYRDSCLNLFFIGDIHNFGFESDFQHVFMEEENGEIISVYLVYRDNMCLQSYNGRLDRLFAEKLLREYEVNNISGETALLEKYDFSSFGCSTYCHFASLSDPCEVSDDGLVKRLGAEDVSQILELSNSVFALNTRSRDSIMEKFETQSGRYYGIKVNDKLVSLASTTAECEGLAMIVGVGTDEDYRGRGYASKVVGRLSNDLLKEGKMPCLFYVNPAAARIYKKLGYRDIGNWTIIRKGEE